MEKRIIVILFAAALLFMPAVDGLWQAPFDANAAARAKKELKTVVFKTHMHCENCVKKLMENIAYVKGVEDLKISLQDQTIVLTYDANKTDADKLANEIKNLGYPAIPANNQNR